MMDTPIPDGSISVRESADAPLIWFFLFGSWKVEASSLSQRLPFFLLGAHNLGPQGGTSTTTPFRSRTRCGGWPFLESRQTFQRQN
jgi:hypothetical protein